MSSAPHPTTDEQAGDPTLADDHSESSAGDSADHRSGGGSSLAKKLAIGAVVGVTIVILGAFGLTRSNDDGTDIGTEADAAVIAPQDIASSVGPPADTLDGLITQLQTRLEAVPGDHVAWSTLGIAYIQQARIIADPTFYDRADGAFAESFEVQPDGNFLAYAGQSALASARHDFAGAKELAEAGLAINGSSSILYGALSDAELQLGEYDAATDSVNEMLRLAPDSSSFARASYLFELKGNVDAAESLMQRALDNAGTPSDRAFALTYLGELAFNSGDASAALDLYNRARAQAPNDAPSLAGKARAEAALGQVETAVDHYEELIDTAPEPSYIAEFGELLESLGRTDEAQVQYDLFDTVQRLYEANGVQPDAGPTLFYANHGAPEQSLRDAEIGVAARPFLAMYDAYAWALHVNGRDTEALEAIGTAQQQGWRNALIFYHSGMIKRSLGDLDGARADLAEAFEINPHFSPLAVPIASAMLAELNSAG